MKRILPDVVETMDRHSARFTQEDCAIMLARAVFRGAIEDGLYSEPEDYEDQGALLWLLEDPELTPKQREELQKELKKDSLAKFIEARNSAIEFLENEEISMPFAKTYGYELTSDNVKTLTRAIKDRYPLF